ncbi:MAG: serine hydrolase domain-containing protein [Bryobacteraceae bacterium]
MGAFTRSTGTILLAFAATGFAQTYDLSELDPLFTRAATAVPPGLEVLIVQNGRQVYWKQFGRWPKDNQVEIASGTKWLSGALIMSLVDSGLLPLDDTASKYLPYMTGDKARITLRQLLSHTAGFPGEFPAADPCLRSSFGTLDRCAQSLARLRLAATPGTAFIYSGADMQIAGRVAEVAAGKDWQSLFRERIGGPLGLAATDYEYKGPTRNPRISGGARSTVSDYMRFLTMIYQRGVFNGKRILSARAIDVMLADQTRGVPILQSPYRQFARLDPRAPANRYGIGNWLEDVDGQFQSPQNSSQGALGFSPLIDRSRGLLAVVGVRNLLGNFEPYYYQMKTILHRTIPAARH